MDLNRMKQQLLDCSTNFESDQLFPTVVPEAAPLVMTDPYAFAIAICLDRGTKADIIWTIPYDMKNILGHLNPSRIHKMSQEELTDLFGQLKRRPRYVNAAPRTVKELTKLVVEEFGGDASLMWLDKPAGQVKATLLRVHGVGEGIANMVILLIEAAFGMRFPDLDRPRMDIKADVHTMRVLYRLGVAAQESEWAAMDAARRISPEFPGAIDGALWHIGRTWCFSNIPNCEDCCVQSVCAKVEV